ncbi:MAG: hypothetical protein JWP09_405 [Candidatus Taylorbacteria bacterium]|nr:hypothetical protein [Candidatus Taylorbacteria bacterium]
MKEKTKDEEGGIPVVWRPTKLGFLPKFWIMRVQAILGIYLAIIFVLGSHFC